MDAYVDRVVAQFDFLAAAGPITQLSGGSNSCTYRIGRYVLKISTLPVAAQFEREVTTMQSLQDRIHVPRVHVADTSQTIIPRNFFVQSYVEGDVLAARWDELSAADRVRYLRQICDQAREIHRLPATTAPPLSADLIQWYLDRCRERSAIPGPVLAKLERYVDAHGDLATVHAVTTHGDLQFYNMILADGDTAIYFIDFDTVYAAAREREILSLVWTAFHHEAAATHFIKPSYAGNLASIREYCPDWFASDHLVETMRLFAVPRICYTFDSAAKAGYNPRASESKGRLLYELYFEDPVWEAYMRGERVDALT